MTYTTGIPTTAQSLGVSRPIIQDNFDVLSARFAVNHEPLNNANPGVHTTVDLLSQAGNADPPLGQVSHFSKPVLGITEWFFQREQAGVPPGPVIKMSKGTPIPTNHGYTFLPGGLILSFGNRVGTGLVTFGYTAYTAIFSITTATTAGAAAVPTLTLLNANLSVGAGTNVYYMVIGI